MKYKLVFIIFISLYSCKTNGIRNDLKKADAVTIRFYKNAMQDSILKIVHTTSEEAIDKLASFISEEETKEINCPKDGDIVFTQGDKPLFIGSFNALNGKCREFVFLYKGKRYATKVGNEAADFLTSLWAGKNYY